jgi:hypothetical protein
MLKQTVHEWIAYKSGDRVSCVCDANESLTLGRIYTIAAFTDPADGTSQGSLKVEGLAGEWRADCFKPAGPIRRMPTKRL